MHLGRAALLRERVALSTLPVRAIMLGNPSLPQAYWIARKELWRRSSEAAFNMGEYETALACLGGERELLENQLRGEFSDWDWRYQMAMNWNNTGAALFYRMDLKGSKEALSRAFDVLGTSDEFGPDAFSPSQWSEQYVKLCGNMAQVCRTMGDLSAAEALAVEAVLALEQAPEMDPATVVRTRELLESIRHEHASALTPPPSS